MSNQELSLRKLATVLGVSQPFLSQIRAGKRPLPEALKMKVEAHGAYHLLTGDKHVSESPGDEGAGQTERPPLRMAFLKLIKLWRECEGVEPTYPARHEA